MPLPSGGTHHSPRKLAVAEIFMLMLPLVLGHADKTTLGRSGITTQPLWIRWTISRNVHIDVENPPFVEHFPGKNGLSTSFGMFIPGYPCKNPPRDSLTLTIGVVPCRHTGISGALRMRRQDAVPGDVANS